MSSNTPPDYIVRRAAPRDIAALPEIERTAGQHFARQLLECSGVGQLWVAAAPARAGSFGSTVAAKCVGEVVDPQDRPVWRWERQRSAIAVMTPTGHRRRGAGRTRVALP